ncbi:Cytokine receptor common subunit beta [Sciurus carolinensis]|uniref:Cytokine receptor common subunit beta n=1 Tax=Sciurus carolinensis TaxID=30640 RepID=A0AA41MHV0_SCICA|nr:Cytokine receptor common subunit beta [Sciurus carolinensis]
MALSWGLLLLALLALWGPGVAGAEETIPLQTLRCYNDYTSHIACGWAAARAAQGLLNLTLHRSVNGDPPQPVSCGLSEDTPSPACPAAPCVHRSCRIAYQDFVIADEDYYFFQADRPLGVQLSVLLTQHVQPPPPKDLQISKARDHFLLTWSVALGDAQTPWLAQGDLEFEVVYRRLSDSWEDATSLRCSSSQAVLEAERLVPGSTYAARVRTRLAPGSRLSGRPSQWSPDILWDSPPAMSCELSGHQTLSSLLCVNEHQRAGLVSAAVSSSPRGACRRPCLGRGVDLPAPRVLWAPGWQVLAEGEAQAAAQTWDLPMLSPCCPRALDGAGSDPGPSLPGDEAQPRNLQCSFDGAHVLSCSWELRAPVASSLSFGLFYRAGPQAREEECSPVLKEVLSSLDARLRCRIPVPDPAASGLYVVSVHPRREGRLIKSSEHIQMKNPTLQVTKDGDSYSLRWQVEKMYYTHIEHTFQVQHRRDTEPWEMKNPTLQVTKDGDSYSLRWQVEKMYYTHIEHTFQVQHRRDTEPWEDSKTVTLRSTHSMALPALEPSTKYWARVRVRPTPGVYNGIWSEWSQEQSWTTDWDPHYPASVALMCLSLEGTPAVHRHLSAPSADFGDCEVSPLTTEDAHAVCSPPSGPSTTPAASGPHPGPPPSPPPGPPAPSGRPANRLPSFDFNGPYLGPPLSGSLPDLPGQPAPPQSHKPAPAGSLEYLCLPPGGQVQLVPLAQVTGQGQAVDVGRQPSPVAEGSPSLESRGGPAPPAPGLRVGARDPEPSPAPLPVSSGDPEVPGVASAYVTTADLTLALPSGTPSASPAPPRGLPLVHNPGLCLGPPGGPPGTPDPGKPGFEGYVELPATVGQCPRSPLGSPASPVSSTHIPSPGEPREEVALPSPPAEGLLVLQQVGDYCFLPGLGPGPVSPQSKPSSPGPCPELGVLDEVHPAKKAPWPPKPQVPAIQFFKSLKRQDHLPGTPGGPGRCAEALQTSS